MSQLYLGLFMIVNPSAAITVVDKNLRRMPSYACTRLRLTSLKSDVMTAGGGHNPSVQQLSVSLTGLTTLTQYIISGIKSKDVSAGA